MILRTRLFGSAHGHQISKHLQRTTDDLRQVKHGSLYPALHRLEKKGGSPPKWEISESGPNREFKYYRLTPAGKKQLPVEESTWKKLTMWPAEEITCAGKFTPLGRAAHVDELPATLQKPLG